MILRSLPLRALFAALAVVACPVWAQGADDTALVHERAAIGKRLAREEAACYQQFAVNDCLRRARKQARIERAEVLQRESAAKDLIRRGRSDQRLQELQGKQESAASFIAERETHAEPRAFRTRRPSQPAARAPRRAVDQGVQAKAAEQRAKDAAQARQRQMDKQRAAAERAQAQKRRMAQRDAQGHAHPAPLPDSY
ncbi:MAG: hypothetical protein ACTS8S_01565 [Giesbergeria sp.]